MAGALGVGLIDRIGQNGFGLEILEFGLESE